LLSGETLTIDSRTFKKKFEFLYLGRTIISNDGGVEEEVENREDAGRRVLDGTRAIIKSKFFIGGSQGGSKGVPTRSSFAVRKRRSVLFEGVP